ncbi:MAG: hypothetical protein K6F59_00740 [Gammaproteobacteria bacterium]|nr:hypothetical protein [Gammaproteobacteria bacterium]
MLVKTIVIVVIIFALAVVSSFIIGTIGYAIGTASIIESILLIYSDNMCAFTYVMNQRKMHNRKFKSNWTIIYLVMLFVPILGYISVYKLNKILSNHELLSNKSVIDINTTL